MTRLLRAGLDAAERISLAIAVALADDKTRSFVAALFPDDAEYVAFLNDPAKAFLSADPWIEGAA